MKFLTPVSHGLSVRWMAPALLCLLIFAVTVRLSAQPVIPNMTPSDKLESFIQSVVKETVEKFGGAGLSADDLAITLIDLSDKARPQWAQHRGEIPIYPASVVKLFYLVAAQHQIETGALKETPELDRALHDMIVSSSNDATHYVVDVLTGTTDGPELDDAALKAFMEKRNAVNRYFASLGYQHINVEQKTWCEGPYGREKQALGPNNENRNMLTTDAVARLWFEIVTGRAASPAHCQAMMDLLHRDPFLKSDDPDDQATAFMGKSLPPGSQYYSKAGWTSSTRHDSAYIRLPNGAEYILVVFTVNHSRQTDIIPYISKSIRTTFRKRESSTPS